MWPNPVEEMFEPEAKEQNRPTLMSRLKAAAQTIADDPGVREGTLMIVTALGTLLIRAMSPKRPSPLHRASDHK